MTEVKRSWNKCVATIVWQAVYAAKALDGACADTICLSGCEQAKRRAHRAWIPTIGIIFIILTVLSKPSIRMLCT